MRIPVLFFRRLALLVLMFSCAWLALACSDPYPPETLVERLRILGVRAEPPDVGLDGQCAMDALIADPEGQGRSLSYTWAVCMVQITGVAKDLQCPGPDSYVLGDTASAVLSIPELAAWAMEKGFPMDPEKIGIDKGGQLTGIPLIVGLRVSATGGDAVTAIKRVRLRLTAQTEGNSNPTILDLENQGQQGLVHLGEQASFTPIVSDDSREFYTPDGEKLQRQEDLIFSWYSTSGEFRDRWTVLDVSDEGQALEENEWIIPEKQEELGDQKLWLVVRDGRWGIDWAEYDFSVEP